MTTLLAFPDDDRPPTGLPPLDPADMPDDLWVAPLVDPLAFGLCERHGDRSSCVAVCWLDPAQRPTPPRRWWRR